VDSNLRLAWTQIVTGEDYDEHMGAVGQAQALAALTTKLIQAADLRERSRFVIAGAGTGQIFEFVDPHLFRPFDLVCTDLNPVFLARLRERLARRGLTALIIADDLEQTVLRERPDFLLAALLLEHIDWRKGVEVITELRPARCGIIIQENPPGMTTAVTPGRRTPPSIAAAVEIAKPNLIPHGELLSAFKARTYRCVLTDYQEVADGKRLISTLLAAQTHF
jgi:hypothetical protein